MTRNNYDVISNVISLHVHYVTLLAKDYGCGMISNRKNVSILIPVFNKTAPNQGGVLKG
jgi:hypothetical protein